MIMNHGLGYDSGSGKDNGSGKDRWSGYDSGSGKDSGSGNDSASGYISETANDSRFSKTKSALLTNDLSSSWPQAPESPLSPPKVLE